MERNPVEEDGNNDNDSLTSNSEESNDIEDRLGLGSLSDFENADDDIDTSNSNDSEDDRESSSSSIDNNTKVPHEEAKPPYRTDVGLPTSHCFQIELADILGLHGSDLKLDDEIEGHVKNHSDGGK